MTKDEALMLVRGNICSAKLCEINSMSSRREMIRLMDDAIAVIDQALAQPEPVIDKSAAIRIATSLDWTPHRTWVSLTDEEWDMTHWSPDFRAGAKWAEEKLRKKNI